VLTTFLNLIAIRHQRIPVCAPWCNGRIESFFGRIKPYIRQIHIHSPAGLQNTLGDIRHFFNHVRTHQNLAGLTPSNFASFEAGYGASDTWTRHWGKPAKKNQPRTVGFLKVLVELAGFEPASVSHLRADLHV
jgi:Integrase core domain